ncbi:hypothetical protein GQ44DRAFT_68160 [Phaeosphaeriaceae sp. PMI808]|nr:hypothetical protein GQ44DRAFT_68160 [Phaeosphaeriaceae sp. PMI808]
MADQDSTLSIVAAAIGVIGLILQLVTLFFAVLAGIYARLLWLSDRISPAHVLELTDILQSQHNETEAMVKSLKNFNLVNDDFVEDLKQSFVSVFETEIEIGRRILKSKKLLKRLGSWHKLQALRKKREEGMQALRNKYLDARLGVISQYATSFSVYKRIVSDPTVRQLVQLAQRQSDTQDFTDISPAPHTAELNLNDLWSQAMGQIQPIQSHEDGLDLAENLGTREEFIRRLQSVGHRINSSRTGRFIRGARDLPM